jgi:N-acetyl-beta-hexosaminidase
VVAQVFRAVADIFPDEYFHIGADEARIVDV